MEAIVDSRKVFAHPDLKYEKKGKVRDLWGSPVHPDLLILFATDRISAYDVVLPTPIPGKGEDLTRISLAWFNWLNDIPNHLISIDDIPELSQSLRVHLIKFKDRITIARRMSAIGAEAVVRGYLEGSSFKAYKAGEPICGICLPNGMRRYGKFSSPLFTPTTKAEIGHDLPLETETELAYIIQTHMDAHGITDSQYLNALKLAKEMKELSITIFNRAQEFANDRGIIIADTKFEFSLFNRQLTLIDELLTPDSSRFWPFDDWFNGGKPYQYDKQFVREYLDSIGWDHRPETAPKLPPNVVGHTQERYQEITELLCV
ncbi:MAG: phosphoribosylaminoimidazolesuccinocarboxamide synthase [Patescibacteria group bacterium]